MVIFGLKVMVVIDKLQIYAFITRIHYSPLLSLYHNE